MAAHRFWRLDNLVNRGDTYTGVQFFELRDAAGVNQATNPAGASASSNFGGQEAGHAIRGQSGNWATQANATNIWWEYDAGPGNAFELHTIAIFGRGDPGTREPQTLDVQWSDTGNGVDWQTDGTITDPGGAYTTGELRTFLAPPPTVPVPADAHVVQAGLVVLQRNAAVPTRVVQAGLLVMTRAPGVPSRVSQAGLLVITRAPGVPTRVSLAGMLVIAGRPPDGAPGARRDRARVFVTS